MKRGPNVLHQIQKHGLIGNTTTVAEKIKEYLEAGVTQFLLAFQDPFDISSIELFNDVIKAVKWNRLNYFRICYNLIYYIISKLLKSIIKIEKW